MNTELETYRNDLLFALRLRDVSGARIGEVLAEVDSHVRETGESPVEAFGQPKEYAAEVVAALGPSDVTGMTGWRWGHTVLIGVGSFVGALLLVDAVLAWSLDQRAPLGLPPAVTGVAGLAALAGIAVWLVRSTRRSDDRVLDPRTGRDMAPPLPRWAIGMLIAVPLLTVVLSVVIAILVES